MNSNIDLEGGFVVRGNTQFTREQIKAIKGLLHDLRRADRDRQKAIRGKLRKQYGFFITDFGGHGFTTGDLDDLITSGRIKVID